MLRMAALRRAFMWTNPLQGGLTTGSSKMLSCWQWNESPLNHHCFIDECQSHLTTIKSRLKSITSPLLNNWNNSTIEWKMSRIVDVDEWMFEHRDETLTTWWLWAPDDRQPQRCKLLPRVWSKKSNFLRENSDLLDRKMWLTQHMGTLGCTWSWLLFILLLLVADVSVCNFGLWGHSHQRFWQWLSRMFQKKWENDLRYYPLSKKRSHALFPLLWFYIIPKRAPTTHAVAPSKKFAFWHNIIASLSEGAESAEFAPKRTVLLSKPFQKKTYSIEVCFSKGHVPPVQHFSQKKTQSIPQKCDKVWRDPMVFPTAGGCNFPRFHGPAQSQDATTAMPTTQLLDMRANSSDIRWSVSVRASVSSAKACRSRMRHGNHWAHDMLWILSLIVRYH